MKQKSNFYVVSRDETKTKIYKNSKLHLTMETKNAKITSTQLGIEDHGIMSFYLYLDYGGTGQRAGGYCLDTPLKKDDGTFIKRTGTAAGMSLIMEILKIVGVENWEDLPNKNIRVKATHNKVLAIGHYLKDNWLDFEEFFKTQLVQPEP